MCPKLTSNRTIANVSLSAPIWPLRLHVRLSRTTKEPLILHNSVLETLTFEGA